MSDQSNRSKGRFSLSDIDTPTREMVAAWATHSPNGSAFANPLGSPRTKGMVSYPTPGTVQLSDAGRAEIGECEAPDQDEIWCRVDAICSGPERNGACRHDFAEVWRLVPMPNARRSNGTIRRVRAEGSGEIEIPFDRPASAVLGVCSRKKFASVAKRTAGQFRFQSLGIKFDVAR